MPARVDSADAGKTARDEASAVAGKPPAVAASATPNEQEADSSEYEIVEESEEEEASDPDAVQDEGNYQYEDEGNYQRKGEGNYKRKGDEMHHGGRRISDEQYEKRFGRGRRVDEEGFAIAPPPPGADRAYLSV